LLPQGIKLLLRPGESIDDRLGELRVRRYGVKCFWGSLAHANAIGVRVPIAPLHTEKAIRYWLSATRKRRGLSTKGHEGARIREQEKAAGY
jgi:hypothetical protein